MASRATRWRVKANTLGFRRCESQKIGYDSYDRALDAAERMMAAGKVAPGCHQTPYECRRCGEWHIFNRVIVKVQ